MKVFFVCICLFVCLVRLHPFNGFFLGGRIVKLSLDVKKKITYVSKFKLLRTFVKDFLISTLLLKSLKQLTLIEFFLGASTVRKIIKKLFSMYQQFFLTFFKIGEKYCHLKTSS